MSYFAILHCILLFSFVLSSLAASGAPPATPSSIASRQAPTNYEIVSEKEVYSRWRTVIQRKVRYPKGTIVDFDIQDQKGAGAVIIFAWDSKTKTATIVREYMPGCHKVLGGLAAGIIETCPDKHDSEPLLAAKHELEEECHLAGGTWHRLTDEGVAVSMDKYVQTKITAYLVIDAMRVDDPRPLDEEEEIEIVQGVSADEIIQMVRGGDMNLVGAWASLLALQKLRDLGEIE